MLTEVKLSSWVQPRLLLSVQPGLGSAVGFWSSSAQAVELPGDCEPGCGCRGLASMGIHAHRSVLGSLLQTLLGIVSHLLLMVEAFTLGVNTCSGATVSGNVRRMRVVSSLDTPLRDVMDWGHGCPELCGLDGAHPHAVQCRAFTLLTMSPVNLETVSGICISTVFIVISLCKPVSVYPKKCAGLQCAWLKHPPILLASRRLVSFSLVALELDEEGGCQNRPH